MICFEKSMTCPLIPGIHRTYDLGFNDSQYLEKTVLIVSPIASNEMFSCRLIPFKKPLQRATLFESV